MIAAVESSKFNTITKLAARTAYVVIHEGMVVFQSYKSVPAIKFQLKHGGKLATVIREDAQFRRVNRQIERILRD